MKNVTASGNTAYQGGILYASGNSMATVTGGNFTGNIASNNGGVFDYRASKAMTITDGVYIGNSAKNGGVLHAKASTVTVTSSEFKENVATSKGGAIYATDTGAKVTVNGNTKLSSNTAPYAGAVYLDLNAQVIIDGSTLDGNTSTTGEGGAIMVADSTEDNPQAQTRLDMTGVTLSNNTAKTRGGALATDYNSPKVIINATNCTFTNNSAPTSGGAVCVQCCNCNSAEDPTEVNIVFTSCTFTENTSSLGDALDIRSGSCLKIDGITATGNTTTDGAAVVYVTSNNSRLYLTGTVAAQNNTASSGKFATLANNSYTTPPKIYTTHANTADWYADVAGNRKNVAFDLTTLP